MFTSPYPVMALFYSCVKPQHQQNYGEQNGIVTHVENVSELVCCIIVSDDFEIALYPHSVSLAFKCLIMLNWTENWQILMLGLCGYLKSHPRLCLLKHMGSLFLFLNQDVQIRVKKSASFYIIEST